MVREKNLKTNLLIIAIISIFVIVAFSLVIESEKEIDQKTKLPTIEIVVEDSIYPKEKTYYDGKASITFPDNSGNIFNENMQIRARGNGSLSHAKSSYKIKFDDKVYLMGEETSAARDWVLLANFIDISMSRNHYALECAKKLDNIEYVPTTMFVEVILNGYYEGVYQVYESIEFDEARLDISDEHQGEQNGFLIERDVLPNGEENDEHIVVEGISYNLQSDVHTVEQIDYVKEIISNVEDAIYSHNQELIESLIDVPSSIDIYLLAEFTKNLDVGWGSFYMYLYPDDSVLYFGPPWDFDLAMGNDYRLDDGSYEGLYVGNSEYDIAQNHDWFVQLMQQEWYQDKVKERWNEIKHVFVETLEEVILFKEQYKDSFLKDQEIWAFEDRLKTHIMRPNFLEEFTTFDQHFDYLTSWIENRYTWLDNYYNNEM